MSVVSVFSGSLVPVAACPDLLPAFYLFRLS